MQKSPLLSHACLIVACSTFLFPHTTCAWRKQKKTDHQRSTALQKGPSGKKIAELSWDESQDALAYYRSQANDGQLIKVLERLLQLAQSPEVREPLTLELADALYRQERYDEAESAFRGYQRLYQGRHREYVDFMILLCEDAQRLRPRLDQATTHKTRQHAQRHREQFPHSRYHDQARSIERTCLFRLLEHECDIVSHYLHRRYVRTSRASCLSSAKKRLQQVCDDIVEKLDTQLAASVRQQLPGDNAEQGKDAMHQRLVSAYNQLMTYLNEYTDDEKNNSWLPL